MKRLSILIFILLSLHIISVTAYELEVESFSEEEILLALTNVETVDVKINNVQATAESASISDTYTVQATLQTEGEIILISIDVSPIFQDYSAEQLQSIMVSGELEIAGEITEFGKRVPVRSEQTNQRALAPAAESTTLIYWIVALALVLVFLILVLFYKKPSTKKQISLIAKKKGKKRKSLAKKKKTIKKSKKRL